MAVSLRGLDAESRHNIVKEPLLEDPNLPEGWVRRVVQRKSGATAGKYDVYIFSPEGKKFRSRNELRLFLARENLDLDPSRFNFSVWKKQLRPKAESSDLHNESPIREGPSHEIKIETGEPEEVENEVTIKTEETVQCSTEEELPPLSVEAKEVPEAEQPKCTTVETFPFPHATKQEVVDVVDEVELSSHDCTIDVPEEEKKTSNNIETFPLELVVAKQTVKEEEKPIICSQTMEMSDKCMTATRDCDMEVTSSFPLKVSKWIPPRSPYNLIQETLYHDPWQLLIATIFLNRTSAKVAVALIWTFFALWPTPEAVLSADINEIALLMQPLGLHGKRASLIKRFSNEFISKKWVYPRELHGIGKYGDDSYRIFCVNEWKMVKPNDSMLKMYLSWLWKNYKLLGFD